VVHRKVNSTCLVCTGLSGGTQGSLYRGARRQAPLGCRTGLSGVPQIVWQWSDPTIDCCRPQRSADVVRAPDSEQCMFGRHRTVRCARRQKDVVSVQRLQLWGEAINTPQPGISRCGSPSNIPRYIIDISKCSNTQALNRITR
jgi:hypothetical protein